MIQKALHSLVVRSDNFFLSYITGGKFWQLKVTGFAFFLVLFFSFPNYQYFLSKENYDYAWDFNHQKVREPFAENKQRLGTNEHNKQYRLTPILIAQLYNTTHKVQVMAFLTFVEHLLGLLFFYLIIKLAYDITQDKLISTYFCLGFSFLFVGKDFFWDLSTWLIPFAYFFLMLSIFARNSLLLFVSLFFGFWSDERVLLFSPILFLWWKLYLPQKFKAFSLVYFANIFLYVGLRAYLFINYIKGTDSYKLHPRSTGADYFWCLYEQFHHVPLGLMLPFEGYWLFFIFFVIYFYQSRNTANFKWFLLAFVTSLGALTVSFSILDTTKSVALLFPLLFVTLKLLQTTETPIFIKNTVLIAVSISFLFPTYYFKGDYTWMSPVYYTPIKESIGWLLHTFVNS